MARSLPFFLTAFAVLLPISASHDQCMPNACATSIPFGVPRGAEDGVSAGNETQTRKMVIMR